ncbi:MAG TPA: hypothetical protein VJL34_12425, partial [Anaerolineales bacterium]|nr:hypothetical protein [Anaerolineales bacterium]
MSKRLFALLSLLVVFSMLLAACAQQPAATTVAPVTTPEMTEPPPAMFECTDPIGCVDIAPGDPIHIAWALVVAGPNSSLGVDSRNGAEVAI